MEYRATLPETAEMIDLASKMISVGRGMDLMPPEANPYVPITAYRYSFYDKVEGHDKDLYKCTQWYKYVFLLNLIMKLAR
jgi:hypothetical protein